MHASMYFWFGNLARPDIKSTNCFDAAKAGERTSTTRFQKDSPYQFQNWRALKPGNEITFWSGKWNPAKQAFDGEALVCIVTEAPKLIHLPSLNPLERDAWSRAEGWAAEWIDVHLQKGGPEWGLQIRYRVK